jgi:hypothetical protein
MSTWKAPRHPHRAGQLGGQGGGVSAERVERGEADLCLPASSRAASQPAYTVPVGPGSTSGSRARRPRVRSVIRWRTG